MRKFVRLGLIAGLALAWFALPLQAATVTSADFSLAYGATGINTDPAVWTTDETSSTNTATTLGDFTFAPAVTGGSWDIWGPTFVNRVLASGDSTSRVAWFGDGGGKSFSVPIIASYNGPAPGDASGTPDYKLLIEITKISVYGARYDASTLATMAWDETTTGHEQTSPSINLNIGTSTAEEANAATYTQLVWNPDDYDVALGSLNDTFTRTFDILPGDGGDYRYGDGLEIEGRVHLVYNAVPEPSSIIGVGLGLGSLVGFGRWRKVRS